MRHAPSVRWRLQRAPGGRWRAEVGIAPDLEGGYMLGGDAVACGVVGAAEGDDAPSALQKAAAVALKMTKVSPEVRDSLPPKAQAALTAIRLLAIAAKRGQLQRTLKKAAEPIRKLGNTLAKIKKLWPW